MQDSRIMFKLFGDDLHPTLLHLADSGAGVYGVSGEHLAAGGFGVVRRCYRPANGVLQLCVVKQVPLGKGGKEAVQHEYEMLEAVKHVPGTVKCVQRPIYHPLEGYLVTEFIPGGSLESFMQTNTSFTETDYKFGLKRKLLCQLCLVIKDLHKLKIVHRDIKPNNLMYDDSKGCIYLIDFGLAERSESGHVEGYAGTDMYMSPEEVLPYVSGQCSFTFDGAMADMWAVGLTAFLLFTGFVPFPYLMSRAEYKVERGRPKRERLARLAQAYQEWQTQWHDETDPRWVRLLECSNRHAYECMRQLLHPQPDKRSSAAHILHCTFLSPAAETAEAAYGSLPSTLVSSATRVGSMTLPSKVSSLDGVDDSMGDSHVAGQSADPMGTMQSQLIPVPGQSDLLWRPGHGPFMNTITGPVFWCYSAEEQDAPAALVKVTDLFGQEYMDMPAYNNPEEQMGARACALALHLNEEISLFRDFAEADGILTPRVHLVDDTRYATLGLPEAHSPEAFMSLETFVNSMSDGDCVHPHGIQLLAKRILQVLYEAHGCGCIMGVIPPGAFVLAPEVFLVDASYCDVPDKGWAKLALGPIEYMPPETLRAVLNRRQPNQHSRSSAGDMFSSSDMLGVLLWRLGKGQLPFRASNKLSSTLAPKTAVKRAKKIATMHDKWKGVDPEHVTGLSSLQREMMAFISCLMSPDLCHRPSSEQALAHDFLSSHSMALAEEELKHCLPDYCQETDLLPILPKGYASSSMPATGGQREIAVLDGADSVQAYGPDGALLHQRPAPAHNAAVPLSQASSGAGLETADSTPLKGNAVVSKAMVDQPMSPVSALHFPGNRGTSVQSHVLEEAAAVPVGSSGSASVPTRALHDRSYAFLHSIKARMQNSNAQPSSLPGLHHNTAAMTVASGAPSDPPSGEAASDNPGSAVNVSLRSSTAARQVWPGRASSLQQMAVDSEDKQHTVQQKPAMQLEGAADVSGVPTNQVQAFDSDNDKSAEDVHAPVGDGGNSTGDVEPSVAEEEDSTGDEHSSAGDRGGSTGDNTASDGEDLTSNGARNASVGNKSDFNTNGGSSVGDRGEPSVGGNSLNTQLGSTSSASTVQLTAKHSRAVASNMLASAADSATSNSDSAVSWSSGEAALEQSSSVIAADEQPDASVALRSSSTHNMGAEFQQAELLKSQDRSMSSVAAVSPPKGILGWSYYTAGAVYGSCLGLVRGLRK